MTEITLAAGMLGVSHAMKPIISVGCKLLDDLAGRSIKVAGGMLEDELYARRCMRAVEIAAKCKAVMDEQKIEPRRLQDSFLLPFLECARDVEDEDLQDLMSRLLASSILKERSRHPALRIAATSISPDEARILRWMHNNRGFLPVVSYGSVSYIWEYWTTQPSLMITQQDQVTFYLENLERLKLVAQFIDLRAFHRPIPQFDFSAIHSHPESIRIAAAVAKELKDAPHGPAAIEGVFELTSIGILFCDSCFLGKSAAT